MVHNEEILQEVHEDQCRNLPRGGIATDTEFTSELVVSPEDPSDSRGQLKGTSSRRTTWKEGEVGAGLAAAGVNGEGVCGTTERLTSRSQCLWLYGTTNAWGSCSCHEASV